MEPRTRLPSQRPCGLGKGPDPCSLCPAGAEYLDGEDDGFLQVLQHKGEHGGGEGHGVSVPWMTTKPSYRA